MAAVTVYVQFFFSSNQFVNCKGMFPKLNCKEPHSSLKRKDNVFSSAIKGRIDKSQVVVMETCAKKRNVLVFASLNPFVKSLNR